MQAHPKLILHIDDDEDDRQMVKETFRQKHPHVIVKEIENGKAGISFLQKAKMFGNLPCLIILDLNMPGMDGKEVLKKVKGDEMLSSIPIVVFTTSSAGVDKLFAKKEGVELVTKPQSSKQLSTIVDNLLSICDKAVAD